MDKLIIVSSDGHAAMPPDTWAKYLEPEYHKYLDRLTDEMAVYAATMDPLNDVAVPADAIAIFDREGRYRSGQWQGAWNLDIRLQEMDREGIAAEFIFPGYFRASDLFHSTMNGAYDARAVDAGARAYNRWLLDEFGPAKDRLLLIGAAITGLDLDAAIKEVHWMADNGFAGIFTPGYCQLPGHPPVYDPYWDPLWAALAKRNLVLITHAGWGLPQGLAFSELDAALSRVRKTGGGDQELVADLFKHVFHSKGIFADLRSRLGVLQFLLGGVFDRHPKLKMMVTEIRIDWLPTTLELLDTLWADNRDTLPSRRKPSEAWATNCMAGLSFMNKTELAMRDEIGAKTMSFGRDYPHTEATWPNTLPLLSDLFKGVSEEETRGILGEYIIDWLKLDRAALAAVAERVGPTFDEISHGPVLDPELKAHLDQRCGYSKPSEGAERLPEIEAMLGTDLRRLAFVAAAE